MDLDYVNNKGVSPIHMSILVHNSHAFEKLAEMKVNVLTEDNLGRTPLSSCNDVMYECDVIILTRMQKERLNRKKSARAVLRKS